MTEVQMWPSVAPALMVSLRHVKKGPSCGTRDSISGGYFVDEENMTCLTNLADSSGCQWVPANGFQGIQQPKDIIVDTLPSTVDGGLLESHKVVHRGHMFQRSDSKLRGGHNNFGHDGNELLKEDHLTQKPGGVKACEIATIPEEAVTVEKGRLSTCSPRRIVFEPTSLGGDTVIRKSQVEKSVWKGMGRHAENRRKRWAQADPLLDLWKAVSASKYAAPFRRPVALLDDYDLIVRQPMDLSTIRRHLENDLSYSSGSLHRDLMLMVTNALVYNKRGTETYEIALRLKDHFTKLFEGHQREMSSVQQKTPPAANSNKLGTKLSSTKQTSQPSATESLGGVDVLPLVPPIKKHRTVRRPRACISSDNGFRSDMGSGAGLDSSSEEEAAAVLICFSSGHSADDKQQALCTLEIAKSESPRKRLKRAGADTDEGSTCSVTQHEKLCPDQVSARWDVNNVSGGLSPLQTVRDVHTRCSSAEVDRVVCITEMHTLRVKEVGNEGGMSIPDSIPHMAQKLTHSQLLPAPAATIQEEKCFNTVRSERACMGLKHKWQERWRMQSAASSEGCASPHQSSEQQPGKLDGEKFSVEGASVPDVNFRALPQGLQI